MKNILIVHQPVLDYIVNITKYRNDLEILNTALNNLLEDTEYYKKIISKKVFYIKISPNLRNNFISEMSKYMFS